MLDIDDAFRIVLEYVGPLPVVEVPLAEAMNRTLAEAVRSDLDSPPFDRALRDGYAVRAADTVNAPVELPIVGQVGAGASFDGVVQAGEAVQINTGAPIPAGADAVVRLEDSTLQSDRQDDRALNEGPLPYGRGSERLVSTRADNPQQTVQDVPSAATVRIEKSVRAGKSIARRGEYVRVGDTVLAAGARLTPVAIGAAAAAGSARVKVYRQPQVAILSTGNELVDVETIPTGPQIRNSNQFVLEALIRSCHAKPIILGVAQDDRAQILETIERGLAADMLCITGGVSVGAFDFVPDCLRELGANLRVDKISIKPGRPTIFATMPDGKPVFALPGNPGGTVVAFELLVRPALEKMQGRIDITHEYHCARLIGELDPPGERQSFIPAKAAVRDNGEFEAMPLSWGGSGDAMRMAEANALIMMPAGSLAAKKGEPIRILLLDRA